MKVWNESHDLVKEIYILTNDFPSTERYRLTEQLCKAAASIAANIAEGTGRYSKKDFVKFLYISRGSLE
ncbi:MAG: four helix bundle protein, partial [Candidatus Omnitrophota bacterium]